MKDLITTERLNRTNYSKNIFFNYTLNPYGSEYFNITSKTKARLHNQLIIYITKLFLFLNQNPIFDANAKESITAITISANKPV